MAVRRLGKCGCGTVFELPEIDKVRNDQNEECPNPENCNWLNRCSHCQPSNFLTKYAPCDCEDEMIVKRWEQEVNENANDPGYALKGVHRIPQGERWNPALGEYCTTTGDVEKYRKEQGKVYAGREREAPKPYTPDDSCKAKERRMKSLGIEKN